MSEASLNEVTLIGRLGKDPEMKRGENGSTRTAFSLATNEVWKDRNGEQREHVEWHRVVCWGNVAESCGTYLRQGRRVWARGRLRTRKWDDAGTDRYITEVHAMSVIFLDGSKETGQTADDGQHAEPRKQARLGFKGVVEHPNRRSRVHGGSEQSRFPRRR